MVLGWFTRTLAAVALLLTAVNGVRPMVSYRALEIGATPWDVGLVAGAYSALSFCTAVPVGRWVDRLGATWFMVAGTALVASVSLGLPVVGSIAWLVVAHALLGLGTTLYVVAVHGLIASRGDPTGRDGRFGLFTVMTSVGQMAGPALGGLLAGAGPAVPDPVFRICGLLAVAATAGTLSLWWAPPPVTGDAAAEPPIPDAMAQGVARVLRLSGMRQALTASLTIGATVDMLIAYLPLFGERHHVPVATIGMLLAIRACASMLSRAIMLPLLRRLGRVPLLVTSLLATAGAVGAVPAAGGRTALLVLLVAVAGMGLGLAQPITMAWVADRVAAGERATALGLRLMGDRAGQIVVPVAVGGLAGAAGAAAVFPVLGAMLATSASLLIWGRLK